MSVSRQTTSRPSRRPRSTICSARIRASSTVFMNAPSPTFTSSTIASIPAASFFDMIDDAMSGTMSTVAVTSRRAYSFLSAGARSPVWPMIARPIVAPAPRTRRSSSSTPKPGIASSLSRVPPVWPSPRPDIIPNGTPHAATSGPTASESCPRRRPSSACPRRAARAPAREVECLAGAESSRRSESASPLPESPLKYTAMHDAAIW